jgi:OOP family OmpA-OmpF porin
LAQQRPPVHDDLHLDSAERFSELQHLLVGEYVHQQQNHRERLEKLEDFAADRSRAVARTLAEDSKEDPKVRKTLSPVVEDALRASVDENPSVMAGILFPMIGQAVRKAVAAATQQIMDSTNNIIADSMSAERLGWRVEAWKSGRSYAEVVLSHTLSYRVEHIYVIHRATGLLLGQATNQANLLQDSDMVVGMLTAIQDFVRDSFTSNKQADLDVIQVGEFKIWLQHGPIALLAAVISGQPKPALREILVRNVEDIHRSYQVAMARFETTGQSIPGLEDGLEECLVEEVQQGEKTKQSYTKFKVAGWILAALICAVAFYYGRRDLIWNAYIERLRHQPGIVIIDDTRGWRTLTVRGLRDPMAIDPEILLERYDLPRAGVFEYWEPYYSLDPRFANVRRLNSEADALRRMAILFPVDSTNLPIDQLSVLDTIGAQIQQLATDASQQRRRIHIQVVGHTDSTGTSEHNDALSQQRAESIVRFFTGRGIDPSLLSAAGMRDQQSFYSQSIQELDRRVTFAVELH